MVFSVKVHQLIHVHQRWSGGFHHWQFFLLLFDLFASFHLLLGVSELLIWQNRVVILARNIRKFLQRVLVHFKYFQSIHWILSNKTKLKHALQIRDVFLAQTFNSEVFLAGEVQYKLIRSSRFDYGVDSCDFMSATDLTRLENIDVLCSDSQHSTLRKSVPWQLGDVGFK